MPSSDSAAQRRAVTRCRNGSQKKGQLLRLFLGAFVGAMGLAGIAEARECGQSASAFEAEFQTYLSEVRQLATEVEALGYPLEVSLRDMVAETEMAAASLTTEQRDTLCAFFEDHPTIAQAPGNLNVSLRQFATSDGAIPEGFRTTESVGSEPVCMAEGGRSAALIVVFVAELANNIADMFCDASPSGDITAVNVIVCIITGVTGAAESIANFVVTLDDECKDELSDFQFDQAQETTQANFDAVQSRLDVVESKVDPLAGQASLDNLSTRVDQGVDGIRAELDDQRDDRRSFQDLNLRISIEQQLGSEANDRISLFQLPSVVGGRLEMVREIVAEAILMNDDAGKNIDQALISFAQGDTHFNNQEFSLAFSFYRQAYREAAQVGAAPGQKDKR